MRKPSESYLKLKKATDKILSGAGLVILSPVFAGIAIAIKLEDGITAPVFFKQKRVGIHKSHFMLYKFRSMQTDTPHDTPTHLLSDPEQYLTGTGRWLRKTSLDELPQLLNIFQGDMAVVGPRPALWNQYDLLEERDKYGANDIRPGLTGWAQIHGRDELEISEKARLDGYYVRHLNMFMDMRCILGTIRSVLKSEGVVEGGTGARHMQNCNKKKLLIVTNHSYMLYRFRKELIQRLMEDYEVVISTPFVGHEEDLQELGAHCIETEVDRRSVNPVTDLRLLRTYKKILKRENPDLVITYSIKPNIYAGYLCGKMKIPFLANVQGLGTAFQKPVLSDMVTVMYRTALRKVEKVIFENQANAQEFKKRRILSEEKEVVLHGAGINLEEYRYHFYPNNEKIHFLYLGRIMKEKGMDELFGAIERLRKDGCEFVLDLVGFFEEEYRKKVEHLQKEGIVRFYGFQVDPHSIKWAKYAGSGVPYTVKQDNKTGNSLGRIIFRFPNPHSVYLHDTPSRWAFTRNNRAVSHGCVRLQKALDFAFFLLKEPDELLEDRIRIAMDIKPVSEEGKKLPISAAYRELKHYSLEQYIPLFIDYQTVYLSADNNLRYCEDIYKYDPSLLEAMNNLNLKP